MAKNQEIKEVSINGSRVFVENGEVKTMLCGDESLIVTLIENPEKYLKDNGYITLEEFIQRAYKLNEKP